MTDGASDMTGRAEVVVVGGGVSGSVCAGALAGAGVDVVLMSSSLDVVGLPGSGPCLRFPARGGATGAEGPAPGDGGTVAEAIVAAFSRYPDGLAAAWLSEAGIMGAAGGKQAAPRTPGAGSGMWPSWPGLLIDRRLVSIRTKCWLESLEGLRLRQGLATAVSAGREGNGGEGWTVSTAFGEAISARAIVVAVGLGLDGRHVARGTEFEGSRPGEVPADELARSLEGLGVRLRLVSRRVGGMVGGQPTSVGGGQLREENMERFIPAIGRILAGESASDDVPPGEGGGVRLSPRTVLRLEAAVRSGLADPDGALSIYLEGLGAGGPGFAGFPLAVRGGAAPDSAALPPIPYGEGDRWGALLEGPAPAPTPAPAESSRAPSLSHVGEGAFGCPTGVFPDGSAAGEFYVSPGAEDLLVSGLHGDPGGETPPAAAHSGLSVLQDGGMKATLVRPGYTSRGKVLDVEPGTHGPLTEGGRGGGVASGLFFAGEAAGTRGYAQTLASGLGAAQAVLRLLGRGA